MNEPFTVGTTFDFACCGPKDDRVAKATVVTKEEALRFWSENSNSDSASCLKSINDDRTRNPERLDTFIYIKVNHPRRNFELRYYYGRSINDYTPYAKNIVQPPVFVTFAKRTTRLKRLTC